MSGAKSRRRGHDWEREIVRSLSELEHVEAERTLDEPREGNVGDVRVNLPLSVQCKAGKRPRIYDAVQEATEAAEPGEHPVAAVKRMNGRGKKADRLAIMRWSDFLEMVELLRAMGGW